MITFSKRTLGATAAAVVVVGAIVGIAAAGDADPGHYEVADGDTWQSIAASHEITADELQLANDRAATTSDSSHPRTGWMLHVPEASPVTSTTVARTTPPPPSPTTAAPTTTRPAPTTTRPAPSTTITSPPSTSPPAGGDAGFQETFATAESLDRLDFDIHTSRGDDDPLNGEWDGDHNLACEGPDTKRTVHGGQATGDAVGELVWWCAPGSDPTKGHVMTAVDTDTQAVLSFGPKQTFHDVTKVCIEFNMNNLGEGKWAQMLVVPAADVAAHGGSLGFRSGLAREQDLDASLFMPSGDAFSWSFLRGSTHAFMGASRVLDWWGASDKNMETSPAPRHPVCVTEVSGGRLRFDVYRVETGRVESQTVTGSLPDGAVRVIFQDANYDPDKHGGTDLITWHWDNITIEEG